MFAAVEKAINDIAAKHGGNITPELVVEAAREKNSPLHSHFTWDTKKAAHQHLLHQARTLIRSVRVEVTTTQFSVRAPAYVRNPSAPGDAQGYTSIASLRTDEDLAREAVVNEFSRASSALARAKSVAMVLGLSDEIEEVHGRVVQLAERVAGQGAEAH